MARRHALLVSRLVSRCFCSAGLAALWLASAAGCGSSSNGGAEDEVPEAAEAASATPSSSTPVRERNDRDDQASARDPLDDSPVSSVAPDAASTPAAGEGESAAAPGASGSAGEPASEAATPEAPAPVFAACTTSDSYSDCDTLYVSVTFSEPARCVQLTLDDCGTYGRQGFAADAPSRWRLASGSVGNGAGPCELGEFYPGNPSLAAATGSISWDEDAPRPTDIVVDLSLELGGGSDEPISLLTPEPIQASACPD